MSISDILHTKKFPGVVCRGDISGRYDATLARYPGDPTAYLTSRHDRREKVKRQGRQLVDVDAVVEVAQRNSADFMSDHEARLQRIAARKRRMCAC